MPSPPPLLSLFCPAHLPLSIIHVFFVPEELRRQNAALEGAHAELCSVQAQLSQARAEIETIKAVATVSENTKQEAIDQVRSQWQEEVASLQAIMKGKVSGCCLHCAGQTSVHKLNYVFKSTFLCFSNFTCNPNITVPLIGSNK